MQKYKEANDYIFINALSKSCGIKLPQDFEKAIEIAFYENKCFLVPDYYYLIPSKVRYPCIANFSDPKFFKTELYYLMESQPSNYFLIIDAFYSGDDALFFAFNTDYYSIVKNKLNTKDHLIITRKIQDSIKQLIPASSLRC